MLLSEDDFDRVDQDARDLYLVRDDTDLLAALKKELFAIPHIALEIDKPVTVEVLSKELLLIHVRIIELLIDEEEDQNGTLIFKLFRLKFAKEYPHFKG